MTFWVLLQNFMHKRRICQLENEPFLPKKDEWSPFAKSQMHRPKAETITVIRRQYPIMSLLHALQLYSLAKSDHNL
ncbi:hypothetical protein ACFBZI_01330 [Moraxella sp. ZJ142]|uniref:hypothetical protein n=1 Tax=Moraxella marmotae TaxID=3344520 RepID=UPI0035D4640B